MNEKESEEKQLLRHLQDLAALSERKNGPVATNFLGLAEQSLFYGHRALFAPYPYTVTGGYPDAERRIILFGVPEAEATEADAGAGTDSFLSLIRIDRKSTRFTSPPSHRDYLGALLSLGIRRELLGDILPDENGSGVCVFCTAGIAPYLCENLESVRNDRVSCSLITALPPQYACKTRPESLSVASPRLDAIIAAVWHLSRDESHALHHGRQRKAPAGCDPFRSGARQDPLSRPVRRDQKRAQLDHGPAVSVIRKAVASLRNPCYNAAG